MPLDIARLAKFCGMLGSEHDGERASAAAMATNLLRGAGMTWAQLVEAAGRSLAAPPPRPAPAPPRPNPYASAGPNYRDRMGAKVEPERSFVRYGVHLRDHLHRITQGNTDLLTDWERTFIVSLRGGAYPLTERQWCQIDRIELRLGILEQVP